MSVIYVVVDLLEPCYHGRRSDGQPDWPPSPLRLAQALMAGCHYAGTDDQARTALEALVRLAAPTIYTGEHIVGAIPPTYTSRSGTAAGGRKGQVGTSQLARWTDLSHLGFTAQNRVAKPQDAVFLSNPRAVFAIDDPGDRVDVPALDRAARRVPYFGRSQDTCDMSVTRTVPTLPEVRWIGRPSARGATAWRGWSTRCLEWMDLKHRLTVEGSAVPPPLPVPAYAPAIYYTDVHQTSPSTAQPKPLLVLPFARRLDQGRSLAEAASVRRSLAEFWPQVEVFPCLHAGHPNADGVGHGLALTDSWSALSVSSDGRVFSRRNGQSARDESGEPALGSSEGLVGPAAHAYREHSDLFAAPAELVNGVRCLDPSFWTDTAALWVSATPFRAFPDERVLAHLLPGWVADGTGAEILSWSAHRDPRERWQRRCRQPDDGLDTWWISLALDRPVPGPVRLGASRDQGFGLFVPNREDR